MPSNNNNDMDHVFQMLNEVIASLALKIHTLADKVEQLEHSGGGGGGGTASIEDYESGKLYKRNVLLVDKPTETVYRACCETEYTSVSITQDMRDGNLKLVGYESQIIPFNHQPTEEELRNLPEDVVVVVYNSSSNRYNPILTSDNPIVTNNNDD